MSIRPTSKPKPTVKQITIKQPKVVKPPAPKPATTSIVVCYNCGCDNEIDD